MVKYVNYMYITTVTNCNTSTAPISNIQRRCKQRDCDDHKQGQAGVVTGAGKPENISGNVDDVFLNER